MRTPLSVVLATYDRRPILERTLDALDRQSTRDFQILVVDDGSTDGTWEWLETRAAEASQPGLHVFRQENRGQGAARNHALRHVDGGLVLFIGDDVIPRQDFVVEHLRGHELAGTATRAVVGFTDWRRAEMKVTPLLEMVNLEGHQFGYGHMTAGEVVPFTCFYTSNLSLPRQILGDDPFDAAFEHYGWEDVELGYRLSCQGLEIVYHPAAAAEHLHPMDLTSIFKRQRLVGRGSHTLLRLHPELAGSSLLAPDRPPRWFGAGKRLIPALVPVLSAVDRLGVPLTTAVLARVLACAYYLGYEEGERTGRDSPSVAAGGVAA